MLGIGIGPVFLPSGFGVAGGYNPANLSAPLITTHDASAPGTVTEAGGLVSAFAGTGGTNVYSQATGTKQPALVSSYANGNAGITFDGIDDTMAGDATAQGNLRNRSAYTLLLVGGWEAFPASGDGYCFTYATNPGANRLGIAAGQNQSGSAPRRVIARGLDTDAASMISTGAAYPAGIEMLIARVNYTTGKGQLARNGVSIIPLVTFSNMTTGHTSDTSGSAAIGTQPNGTSNPSNYTLAFSQEWAGYLTDEEVAATFSAYAPRFGITL